MDAKFDAKKVLKKRDRNRVVRALAYAAGFPLFVLFVFLGSIPFMSGSAYGATQYYGVYIALAVWAVGIIVQIIAAIVTKNYTGRAIISIIITIVIMIGGAVFFDFWAEKKVDEARVSYVKDMYGLEDDAKVKLSDYPDISIKNYNYQVNSYVAWTKKSGLADEFNGKVSDMTRAYNIGYGSTVKGDVNTDGSKYGAAAKGKDGKTEYWFGEKGNVYKENGLYADGYIFSVPVATEILITYYETQNLYKKQNKDADDELDIALQKAAASSEWQEYKNSEEYKAAYGNGGTADSYMITINRLDKMARALGNGLYVNGVWGIVNSLKGVISGFGIDLDAMGINSTTIRNLSVDSVLAIMNGLGLDVTEDTIKELLEPFSNYEVSNVKPVMYFIEDETLRTYAYAKYFGQVHGANVGSILIPDKKVDTEGNVTYSNIGNVGMSTKGYNYEENGFTLEQLYELRAYNSYAPTLFPLFAARRYTYVFAGIIALMLAIFYYTGMKVKMYAIRLEKLSAVGGDR